MNLNHTRLPIPPLVHTYIFYYKKILKQYLIMEEGGDKIYWNGGVFWAMTFKDEFKPKETGWGAYPFHFGNETKIEKENEQ